MVSSRLRDGFGILVEMLEQLIMGFKLFWGSKKSAVHDSIALREVFHPVMTLIRVPCGLGNKYSRISEYTAFTALQRRDVEGILQSAGVI